MNKAYSTLLLLGCLMCSATALNAQRSELPPVKDIVVVDLFAGNRAVPMVYLQIVREQVLAGFADRGRHQIVDAATSAALSRQPPRGFSDPATIAQQQNDFMQERMASMAEAGARFVVTGAIANYKIQHVEMPSDGKHSVRMGFRAMFDIIISAYDLKLGTHIPDRIYNLKGDAVGAEDADRVALASLRNQLMFYIDSNFKFETSILELCPPTRKGVQELYIHSGTSMGVRNGDLFLVYEEVPIGGVITLQKVGKLRVNNVQNPSVAKCKISKGNEEIARAFAAGRVLTCVSDGQALF